MSNRLILLSGLGLLLLCGCSVLQAEDIETHVLTYSFRDGYATGKAFVGTLGRIDIYSDTAEEFDSYVIHLLNPPVARDWPVDFLEVSIYRNTCKGKPYAIFGYGTEHLKQGVPPQGFSITEDACLGILFKRVVSSPDDVQTEKFEITLVGLRTK